MIEQIKHLNEWKELLDDRVASLNRSIAAMRAELESCGASEQFIRSALCHEYEMLDKIYGEDYPCLQEEMNHLYSDAVSDIANHQVQVEYPSQRSVKKSQAERLWDKASAITKTLETYEIALHPAIYAANQELAMAA